MSNLIHQKKKKKRELKAVKIPNRLDFEWCLPLQQVIQNEIQTPCCVLMDSVADGQLNLLASSQLVLPLHLCRLA